MCRVTWYLFICCRYEANYLVIATDMRTGTLMSVLVSMLCHDLEYKHGDVSLSPRSSLSDIPGLLLYG